MFLGRELTTVQRVTAAIFPRDLTACAAMTGCAPRCSPDPAAPRSIGPRGSPPASAILRPPKGLSTWRELSTASMGGRHKLRRSAGKCTELLKLKQVVGEVDKVRFDRGSMLAIGAEQPAEYSHGPAHSRFIGKLEPVDVIIHIWPE